MKLPRGHSLLIYIYLAVVGIALSCADSLHASTISFADNSRLASGYWVKVSVSATGMHRISAAQLRQMGFSSPENVRVHGYGGARLSDVLSETTVIDDLPQIPSLLTSDGLLFYGVGPQTWTETATNSDRFIHSNNPFTFKGYYFLTEDPSEERAAAVQTTVQRPSDTTGATTYFREHVTHHLELDAMGYSGFTFVGEDMLASPRLSLSIPLPGLTDSSRTNKVWARVSGAARSTSVTYLIPTFTPTLNPLSGGTRVNIPSSEDREYARGQVGYADFASPDLQADALDINLEFAGSATKAFLHFVDVCYDRALALRPEGTTFRSRADKLLISGASDATNVWDVSNPVQPIAMNCTLSGQGAAWYPAAAGLREYVAFNPEGSFPQVEYEETVANQNLHALADADMVIFTLPDWADAAERLAAYRRSASSIKVHVVDINQVFNEFASGAPDVQSFRRLLKMLYDREGSSLKHVLFFGRSLWDYRRVSPAARSGQCLLPAMPSWQTLSSTNEFHSSYTTDDLFGFLSDGDTSNGLRQKMLISVGRIPVNTPALAHASVDKIMAYERSARGEWRSRILTIADESAETRSFMDQTDRMIAKMHAVAPGAQLAGSGVGLMEQKVYLDAYEFSNGQATKAIDEVRRALDEGVAWMTYNGHASMTAWGGVGIMPYTYASTMSLRRKPLVAAGTCEYAQFDGPTVSGAEAMWRNEQGPAGIITATRPAAIATNGDMLYGVTQSITLTKEDGTPLTFGEVNSYGKNMLVNERDGTSARSNALRYVLIGDPSMKHVVPTEAVLLEEIYDITADKKLDLDGTVPPNIRGGSRVRFSGSVVNSAATPMTDFNGEITISLFDGEYDIETLAHVSGVRPYITSLRGGKLSMARASVKDGRWEAEIQVPLEIANNNTAAALSMYALSYDNTRDAIGACREFAVSGFAQPDTDTEAPVINSMYLNHPSFYNGQTVDSSPIFYAKVSDNVSINLSTSGVGRAMTLSLDGERSFTGLDTYFTPDFGACTSGSIAYPLKNLSGGDHTLTFTVWDTADNFAEGTIAFSVDDTVPPALLDVYTDANPASVATNFYVMHDRPDKDVMVGIEVFDLAGRKIWTTSRRAYSEGNLSEPIQWNLTTGAGTRVSSGLYLYRATLSMPDGQIHATRSRKLAVIGM